MIYEQSNSSFITVGGAESEAFYAFLFSERAHVR